MKQNKTLGYVAITVVAIIYGVSYMARNIITDTKAMDPAVITFLQLAIMATLFLAYNLVTKKSMKLEKKHLPIIFLSGFVGTFLFHTLTNLSVSHVGAGVPSLLFGLAAAFSLIVNTLVFRKKTSLLGWVSVVIGLGGLYIIMGITPDNFADTNLLGYGLSIGSVMAWVAYCFLADNVPVHYEKSVILFWNALVGTVVSAPFLVIYPMDMALVAQNMSSILIALVILGVFNATFAYFLNIFAIKLIGVNMANIFLNFMPIATLAAVFLVYGTAPKTNEVIGGLVIIASVLLMGYAENKKSIAK
ncbi:MAG: DMT family transporter [Eubacteriales bacterium]